ncbi:MAG: protein kinase domain-containing protein [Pseudomonadota bacterium]
MDKRLIAGRYRLERPLGTGGTASVWEAQDLELDRRVAVKLLSPDADRVRFEREGRAAAALGHPNVVRVYDVGEDEEGAYLVLELLPGGSLEERLRPGEPLPDAETERIATGIAAGLAHAHARGLVHRDLKPANVLFDGDDRPKLADLGIARLGDDGTLTEAGTVLGTAATIAPEQAAGEAATAASDVYSFGVVLYRMLTGRMPFVADDPLAVAAMHLRDAPPPITDLRPDAPPRLESLAAAALAKHPGDRPADGGALLAELARPAATRATAAGPAAGRRRPATTIGALAAVLVLGAAGAVAAVLATGDDSVPAAGTTSPRARAESVAPPAAAGVTASVPAEPTATTDGVTTADTAGARPTAPATTEAPPVTTTEPPVLTDEPTTTVSPVTSAPPTETTVGTATAP